MTYKKHFWLVVVSSLCVIVVSFTCTPLLDELNYFFIFELKKYSPLTIIDSHTNFLNLILTVIILSIVRK